MESTWISYRGMFEVGSVQQSVHVFKVGGFCPLFTKAPSGINSNLLPPEAAMTCNLPAFVLAAQGGKADCLELLVRRCQPDLDMTYGKKR